MDITHVWAHWYAVYGHTVAALHSYTHTSWLKFGGSWSLVESKCSVHPGWGWEPPQTDSIINFRHLQSAWAHWYAVHVHIVAALHSHTHTSWLNFCVQGHLWSQNDVIASWLRLTATSYTKCLSTLICYPWAYSSSLTQPYPHYLAQILVFWVTYVDSK